VMEGKAVMSDQGAVISEQNFEMGDHRAPITDISQGEAMLACEKLGPEYHLISENEWLTIAENIIKIAANDLDKEAEGLQLDIATSSYLLATGAEIYGISDQIGEWTNMAVKKDDSVHPFNNEWIDYNDIESTKALDNILPPYYLSSANGIGKILTGDNGNTLRGFVRGQGGIYSLDLSHAPNQATSTIGFRCAK